MDEGLSFTDTSPVSSDAQLMAGLIRHRGAAAAAVTALLVAVAGVAYFLKSGTPAPSTADASSPSIASLQVDRLTTSGTADTPAISPDGNYVVYVERGSGGDSLRVRQVATGSNVEIVPLEPGTVLLGATVTPDGAFVNYVKQAAGQALELWQTTLLPGAAPRRLLQGGSVSFSPGGDQMAFVRANTTGRTELVVAASDGSGEHVVSSRQLPKGFWAAASSAIPPAWSPNGATIAVVGFGGALASDGQIVLVDVKSGSERVVDAGLISGTTGVAWLTDDTLLVSRGDKASTPLQLWIVSSADGAFRRLTNDTNQYVGVSLTADRNSLVVARSESSFNILISDATATEWSQPMPTKSTKGPGLAGVRWIGADLVFTSIASQGMALSRWRASIQKEEVLAQGGGRPSVTRDGSTIVFFDYDSAELLNMEAPGQKRVPIPGAGLATLAQVTPDGRHYVTIGLVAGAPAVVLASLDGVTSRVITPDRVRAGTSLLDRRRAEVSPDGKWIAYSSFDEGGQPVIAVCDLASCSSRRTLSAPAAQWWRWTPDSKALAYVDRKTQSDLWAQPLDGGAPHQLTHFAPDGRQIWDFDWSADGRLAMARGLASSDIVLFRGLQACR
jgi:Tol biopolymer transport system component